MKRTSGRNIFIIDLKKVLGSSTPEAFAKKSKNARMSGVWIRAGRGATPDPNLSLKNLADVRKALTDVGVELWGWHVPFCANSTAAATEAAKVLEWVDHARLVGMVVDAERTNENPRFQGTAEEAAAYTNAVVAGLDARGCGVAFSSHDQPALHTDLPFKEFLDRIEDVCPQVYYRIADPSVRLGKSIHDYKALISASQFKSRYRPTGNITVRGDIPFPNVETCLAATTAFLGLVKTAGYLSHSFWCWDTAPNEIWKFFNQTPVWAGPSKGASMKLDEAQVKIQLIQDYVPVGNHNRPGDKLTPTSITIHNTDNDSKGANAAAHARYMKGPDAQKREVSWHFTVDDKFVYQSLPTTEIGWHSGTKAGNYSSIGIEICEHSDMKDVPAAYSRAALLAAWLAYRLNIQVPNGILQHHEWSGKNCPHILRKGGNKGWKGFMKEVQDIYDQLEPVEAALIAHNEKGHHAVKKPA